MRFFFYHSTALAGGKMEMFVTFDEVAPKTHSKKCTSSVLKMLQQCMYTFHHGVSVGHLVTEVHYQSIMLR